MSFRTFVILFSFIFIMSSGCTKKEKMENTAQQSIVNALNVSETKTVEKRIDRASNFSWTDSNGKPIDFDSYRGTVTLVNFWATWCGPCRKEIPDLISLSKEFANRNVKVIGISVDRGPNIIGDIRTFIQDAGIPYQIIIANDDLVDAYGNPRMIPTTFLIDKDGKIVETLVGGRSKEFLAQSITALLK
jgi:thiol-disulfide isomerase/thioredoxin